MEYAYNKYLEEKRNLNTIQVQPVNVVAYQKNEKTSFLTVIMVFKMLFRLGVFVLLLELTTRTDDQYTTMFGFAKYLFSHGSNHNYYIMIIFYILFSLVQALFYLVSFRIGVLPQSWRRFVCSQLSFNSMQAVCVGIVGIEFLCVHIWMRYYHVLYSIVIADAVVTIGLYFCFLFKKF